MQDRKIDFVISWVDGKDQAWRQEKSRYDAASSSDDGEERYRDWDNLKYWFRGVEKFAPWVGKIHFITWGHLPEWLDVNHPRLHIVRHEDYIPQEYLPTFNSHTIEWNMHRIEGLAEQFVYFNDDFFLINKVKPEDFFQHGKPCDMLAFQPVVANPANPVMSHIYLNNSLVISKYFNKRENVKKQPGSYFKIGYPLLYFVYNILEMMFPLYTGFYTVHGPSPFLRDTYRTLWAKEGELLDATCRHRFRNEADVSQYLAREWQKLSGDFQARNITRHFRYFNVESDNPALVKVICGQKAKMICINDANKPIDFVRAKKQVIDAFESILPEKSSFEKSRDMARKLSLEKR